MTGTYSSPDAQFTSQRNAVSIHVLVCLQPLLEATPPDTRALSLTYRCNGYDLLNYGGTTKGKNLPSDNTIFVSQQISLNLAVITQGSTREGRLFGVFALSLSTRRTGPHRDMSSNIRANTAQRCGYFIGSRSHVLP